MGLEEILDALRSHEDWEGAGGYADSIAQIFGDYQAGSQSTIDEVNSKLEQQAGEIMRLQAENYKLITALGANEADNEPSREEDTSGEGEDEEEIDITDYIKKED